MRRPSVSEPSADLVTLYSVIQGSVTLPPMEPTLTIMPLRRSRMCGATSCVMASRREEIQLHQVARLVHGHLPGGLVDADAGIVDENIDGAEALQRAVDDAAAGLVGR